MLIIPCGNDRTPETFTMPNFSEFQLARVTEITGSPAFAFACVPEGWCDGHKPGPISFMWYAVDGQLHYERIGVTRVLSHHTPAMMLKEM